MDSVSNKQSRVNNLDMRSTIQDNSFNNIGPMARAKSHLSLIIPQTNKTIDLRNRTSIDLAN